MTPRRSNEAAWPTKAELDILHVLWERGASTVREVHETLYGDDGAGYTTAHYSPEMQIVSVGISRYFGP